jgi:hippurate hydrolase
MSGAPEPAIKIIEGVASVINDEGVIQRVDAALKTALGADHVDIARPQTPSEDFSVYATQGVPSLTMRIGVYPPELIAAAAAPGGKALASNHSPYFAPVPEPSIKTGIKVTTTALLALMGNR